MTQNGLAQTLQVPQSFISKVEQGERRLDVIELRRICHAIGISFTEFVGKVDKSLPRTSL